MPTEGIVAIGIAVAPQGKGVAAVNEMATATKRGVETVQIVAGWRRVDAMAPRGAKNVTEPIGPDAIASSMVLKGAVSGPPWNGTM